ncbi:MAG: bifunctional pyr operon transcriptional regulator/uracil phosphoribosyltransferase PyrR, partial [Erysipelotrichaceae bacterium]|nr:bifunctional pyr operon transcriptional regulator/uracil phosphoribosyltransferase PyrR [Erysipelotrichaceae bacterium]
IKTRGEYLAKRMTEMINSFEDSNVPCVALDIAPWHDEESKRSQHIEPLGLDVKDKIIVLVDDVLHKGRTVRAAMDGIMHFGRAKEIHLAVLVDRGHRELPIRADYVGKNVPTSEREDIRVRLNEIDGTDGVVLIEERDRK